VPDRRLEAPDIADFESVANADLSGRCRAISMLGIARPVVMGG
jgi:hypothetical protein